MEGAAREGVVTMTGAHEAQLEESENMGNRLGLAPLPSSTPMVFGGRGCMLPPSGWQGLGEVSRLHSLPSCRHRD